jgi:hypothetical protein
MGVVLEIPAVAMLTMTPPAVSKCLMASCMVWIGPRTFVS